MGSTLGLQLREDGSNPVLVHFYSSWFWIDTLTPFALKLVISFAVSENRNVQYLH